MGLQRVASAARDRQMMYAEVRADEENIYLGNYNKWGQQNTRRHPRSSTRDRPISMYRWPRTTVGVMAHDCTRRNGLFRGDRSRHYGGDLLPDLASGASYKQLTYTGKA